ncbi:hypothetical protein TIFTF001_037679 [Ficus carica]|uniref:Uncharacterized protein n=1 Tax=Ficus carica TaxID=3494 RepID=A0AA88E6G1_FICCA|nr:hypothetical protein TIFTF001_037679 [Ficus carica]
MPEQPSAQSNYRGKKANNNEEKPAACEGHTPPTTGNVGPRIDPTPLPLSHSPALVVSKSPRNGHTRI